MKRGRSMGVIQPEYVDALGRRHIAPPSTIRAIEEAVREERTERGHNGTGTGGRTIVTTVGSGLRVGRSEIRLEDGSTVSVRQVLPADLPLGYHELRRPSGNPDRLIVAPPVCHLPRGLRTWGWAIQLYAARSHRSWGIGDLADLRWLGRLASKQGAGFALVSPIGAATPIVPQQPSPYFPSSRRFRSPLYLRIEEVEGARSVDGIRELGVRARALNRYR